MKKTIKLGLICMVIVLSIMVISNKVFAQGSDTVSIEDIFNNIESQNNSEENNNQEQSNENAQQNNNQENSNNNQEQNNNEEQNNNQENSSDNQAQNSNSGNSDVSDIPEIPGDTQTTNNTTTTTNNNTTTETPNAESIEEEKIPQTGEAENYILIIGIMAFSVIAIYAYRKNKKINI